jgi:hypothetical protein
LNAPLLRQVTLFKMPAIGMHLYCIRSCFWECLPFEYTSGHAFQMPAIWMHLRSQVSRERVWCEFPFKAKQCLCGCTCLLRDETRPAMN